MAIENFLRNLMWTEIREALLKDFPDLKVPQQANTEVTKLLTKYVEHIAKDLI